MLNDLQGDNCEIEMVVACPGAEAHRRRYKTKLIELAMLGLDRVIVEPSGLYDVDEFFDVLYEEPLNRMYQVGSVIAIVDSMLEDHLSRNADYFLVSELANAGALVISRKETSGRTEMSARINTSGGTRKDDEAADAAEAGCETAVPDWQQHIPSLLDHINKAMAEWKCSRRFTQDQLITKDWNQFTDDDFAALRDCGWVGADHQKNLGASEQFQHLFYMNLPFSAEESLERIRKLMETDRFGDIFRIKGYLSAGGRKETTWLEINATKEKIDVKPSERGQNVIIVIGEDLDKEAIDAEWPGATTV